MKTKKCTVEPRPEPPPPDPCKLQRRKEKEKAGIVICPPPLIEEVPPPPSCFGLCIEKIKNPDISINNNQQRTVCVVKREVTGTARCDEIKNATTLHPDLPWPGCPPQPKLPLPPEPDLCELQRKREKARECKERMKRYLE